MYNRVILAGVALSFLASCNGKKASEEYYSVTDPKQKVAGSPLYVLVSTSYEGQTDSTTQGACYIDTTTAPPSATSCTVRIPELTLYYSDLHFEIGSNDAVTCAQVAFYPYYYRKDSTSAFTPPGDATPIDCTAGDNAKCFGGAAVTMLDKFPGLKGVYFLPMVVPKATFNLKSSNTLRGDNLKDPALKTNVNAANNLASALRSTPIASPVTYDGTGFQDYQISCNDAWGAPQYVLTLKVADYDTKVNEYDSTEDHFYDWGD